ncbi:MAG: FkbM family methyltransferase [Phycisphaeraceae bacterium]|nr:FkbM family methyltransferase [Phycisphaeraceae bacterium]
MNAAALRDFESSVKLMRANGAVKAVRRPIRMLGSKILERRAHASGGAFPVTGRTFWGAPFHSIIPEGVSTIIYRYGFFEEELTRAFLELLKPGMTFFDVGSHFGYFSLLAFDLVGPSGSVHAFDPTPSTFEMLKKNVGHLKNVTLVNAAGFSREDKLDFTDFGVEYSAYNSLSKGKVAFDKSRPPPTPKHFQVDAITIDGYIERTGAKPNLLKIDAEGAELEILKGMEKTLREVRPIVTLEMGDVGAAKGTRTSRPVVDHILARGYKGYEYKNGARSEHTPLETYPYTNLVFMPA